MAESETCEEIRIVLLGKTGTGKSATGNSIIGEKVFKSTVSLSSITSECSQRSTLRFGYKLVVVDTPGIFDTSQTNEHTQEEICKCIAISSPGPHAFLLVLSASRFTAEEQESIEHFVKHFGKNIYKYVIVLFTRKDDLDDENKSLLNYIKDSPPELRRLIQMCGGRVCAFNNRHTGAEQNTQAKELLQLILENVKINGGNCYTNEMYEEAERLLKEREEEIMREEKEKHEKELKDIEEKLAKEYKVKFDQETKKLQKAQRELEQLIQKQKDNESQVSKLQEEVKTYEHQLKESQGKEKDDMQNHLRLLNSKLAKLEENANNGEREIKELKINKERTEREQQEQVKKQEENLVKVKNELKKEYEEKISKVRDEARKEVEKGKGALSRVFNWFTKKFC